MSEKDDLDAPLSFDLDGEDPDAMAFTAEAAQAAEQVKQQQQAPVPEPEPQPIAEPQIPEPQADVTPESSPGEAAPTDQELNFKKLRGIVADKTAEADKLREEAAALRAEKLALEAAQRVAMQQQQPQPVAQPQLPDPTIDPEGYLNARLEAERQQYANALANASEASARAVLGSEEVDRRYGVYQQLAARNPSMDAQVRGSPSPWFTMCEVVKQHEDVARLRDMGGDPEAIRERIRSEERAKLVAEMQQQTGQDQGPQVSPEQIPSSLANTPSVQAPNPLEAADASLDEILWSEREGGAPY